MSDSSKRSTPSSAEAKSKAAKPKVAKPKAAKPEATPEVVHEANHVPVLPLRDIIVFPHMVVPLFVGRDRSISALEEAMNTNKDILLVAQKKAKTNNPKREDIFEVGTLGSIIQLLRLPDGTVKVLVEGKQRVRIERYLKEEEFFLVEVAPMPEEQGEATVESKALMRSLKSTFETYVKLNKRIPPEMLVSVQTIDEPSRLADTIGAHLQLKLEDKQELLGLPDAGSRMNKLYELMQGEIEILQVEKRIRSRVKRQMEKSQKEYYLNEQMHAIQKELGERDEFQSEIAELEDQIAAKTLSEEAKEKLDRELRRLKMMAPMSAEATVVRNYIDWVLDLPWEVHTDDNRDLERAEEVLEEDHYGLEKVKERIVEHLAVQTLVEKNKGPILCFVGPPGVGKTSLGRSIARATGRAFVRVSLGGVRDEAEIRGHRRTYIGAMPGKIIQYMKRCGSANPVFLLDEVDKMSTDFRGDPSSALLEVLDPEQNNTFNDHYLDLDYDLSDVMFITTANDLQAIPLPLQDRMEIIRLAGYTDEEKLQIARRYLVSKQKELNGLAECALTFSDNAIKTVIQYYTKESGVRSLERELASICRKIAKQVVKQDGQPSFKVTASSVGRYLGVRRYKVTQKEARDDVGLANGLAVTHYGGELLATEVTVMPGKGKLVLTGKLGEVMQESAQAALSYVRSRAISFGLNPHFYEKVDIHVHLPEGAIPKDGPSAGITIVTAMVSALLQIPVRRDVAMTGEITLRGRVLPIGGLKEKILAAGRSEIAKVLIPEENEKDLKEIPKNVLKQVEVVVVPHMDDVLRQALRLEEPDKFLQQPSSVLDWRVAEESPSPSAH
jgi:ATP-dependent Lon protease